MIESSNGGRGATDDANIWRQVVELLIASGDARPDAIHCADELIRLRRAARADGVEAPVAARRPEATTRRRVTTRRDRDYTPIEPTPGPRANVDRISSY